MDAYAEPLAAVEEEAAEPGGEEEERKFPSLQSHGPSNSKGSFQHPDKCEACAFYCFSLRGCRNEDSCTFCHLFHESKLRQRREQWKKRQREKRDQRRTRDVDAARATAVRLPSQRQAETAPSAFHMRQQMQAGVPPAPGPGGMASVAPSAVNAAVPENAGSAPVNQFVQLIAMPDQGMHMLNQGGGEGQQGFSGAGAMGPMQFFNYNPSSVVVGVGQTVEIWPPPDIVSSGMVFAVSPELPPGLSLNRRTGLIQGKAQRATEGAVQFFITACEPTHLVRNVKVAMVEIKVITVQAPGFTISNLVQGEQGVTIVTLREDMGNVPIQIPGMPMQDYVMASGMPVGRPMPGNMNWWTNVGACPYPS